MTRWVLASALVLAACVDGSPDDTDDTDDSDTDTGTTDGCPEGMHAADSPDLVFWTYRINGLLRSPVFDPDLDYQDRPAACISEDGHTIDYFFVLIEEPYGRLIMDAPRGDESYGLNEGDATMSIEIFGEPDGPKFESGEWVNGTWYVTSVGNTFDSDLNGSALDDDEGVSASLAVNLTVTGQR